MNRRTNIKEQRTVVEAVQPTRVVVVDIETVTLDPADDKGALDAMSGRVVCIGMLIDDGQTASEITLADEDEHWLITEFWRTLAPGDVVVGHNVLDFDLRFLRQRSWVLGVKPSRALDTRRYYTREVVDTLQLWTEWSGNKKGVTLNALGAALGCGGKSGNGANVAQWWAERDIDSIKRYCGDDVRLSYRVFCRLTYQEPKQLALDEKQELTTSIAEPLSRRTRSSRSRRDATEVTSCTKSSVLTTCGLCGEHIRFVYVLKVIESPSPSHSHSREVGKLHIGECCFEPIRVVNEKLYRQLLAAAVNLRTYIEAIERDQRIFGAMESEKVESAPPLLGVAALDENSIPQWFEALVKDGGDHV